LCGLIRRFIIQRAYRYVIFFRYRMRPKWPSTLSKHFVTRGVAAPLELVRRRSRCNSAGKVFCNAIFTLLGLPAARGLPFSGRPYRQLRPTTERESIPRPRQIRTGGPGRREKLRSWVVCWKNLRNGMKARRVSTNQVQEPTACVHLASYNSSMTSSSYFSAILFSINVRKSFCRRDGLGLESSLTVVGATEFPALLELVCEECCCVNLLHGNVLIFKIQVIFFSTNKNTCTVRNCTFRVLST
jgi:hypothetical protein